MKTELITKRNDLVIRRLILDPGDEMPWHTDPCQRFTVVVRGDQISIEFRDSDEKVPVTVRPGQAEWDQPEDRVHRGVNSGESVYEEVVIFFLPKPGMDPQPEQD